MNRDRRLVALMAGALLASLAAGPVGAADPPEHRQPQINDKVERLDPADRPGIKVPLSFPGADGQIIYQRADPYNWPFRIWIQDLDGSNLRMLTSPTVGQGDQSPAWSPGGTLIAFTRDQTTSTTDEADDIYLMNADGSGLRRLTKTSAAEYAPNFSPDGARIAFSSNRAGNYEIYTMKIDGTDVRRLTSNAADDGQPNWSPDGKRIAFRSDRAGNDEIYTMNVDGSSVTRLTSNAADDLSPNWSPDGTKIAFSSDRTGDWEILVMNANGSGVLNLTNAPGWYDGYPSWSPDGSWIIYSGDPYGDDDILAMTAGSTFLGAIAATYDYEWNPDWQPLPAFPLVDARFSLFYSDIVWVYNEGITSGCSAERYCPEGYVTREQMASFLARALHLSGSAPDAFTDDESSIHEPNINLVAQAGIASGCAVNKFCPTGLVSREQMASFLARALHLSGAAPDAFTDDETSIHEPNINLVAREGITTGCTATKYCPTQNVTRGQMAAFLHRAFGP